MPLMKSGSKEARDKNIQEMIRAGHDPKNAVAAAYANQRKYKKMSEGGEVDSEDQIQDEHRTLGELQKDAQPENEEPSEMMDEDLMLAKALKKKSFEDDEDDED